MADIRFMINSQNIDLTRLFERMGYKEDQELNFKVVQNDMDAVRAALWFRPKIILTDMERPRSHGLRAVEFIRMFESWSGDKRVPIVAITEHAEGEDKERFLASGIDDFLVKPYTPKKLSTILQSWLLFQSIAENKKAG